MRPYSKIGLILALTAVLHGYGNSYAETLEQITIEALRNNPELQIFEENVRAAKGGLTTARTFPNPELTLGPGVRQVQEGNRNASLFHGEFSFSQLFKFPGKRALEIALAQRNVELMEVAREGFRFQVTTKIRRAFYDFLASQRI